MPLYLVRWPTLKASLVRARDEDELIYYLDEVADPGGYTYKVYKGPVWIDFKLPFTIRDVTPDKKVPTEPSDFTVVPADVISLACMPIIALLRARLHPG